MSAHEHYGPPLTQKEMIEELNRRAKAIADQQGLTLSQLYRRALAQTRESQDK